MTTPIPPDDGPSPLRVEIDAMLRRQRQDLERLARSAGEAARAEVERAVRDGLADALRRLAEELPRLLAASAPSVGESALNAAPEAEETPDRPCQEPAVTRRAGGVSPLISHSHQGADAPRSPAPQRRAPDAAKSVLWLTCPGCGAGASISWKRLNRTFQCRGCSRLYHVNGEGQFTEVRPAGRPRGRRLARRLLIGAAACLVAAAVAWLFVRPHGPTEAPLPQDLKARAELWGKAWVRNDRYTLRRLTDPACDKALHPWLQRHRPPADAAPQVDAGSDAEIEARVDRSGDRQAVLVIQVKSRSLKVPIEVRQSWVERGDAWYFVPS
jgi:hypothetical protein